MMVVCPVCGQEVGVVGGDDDDEAAEIICRRAQGEVTCRIWGTAGTVTNELLHECDLDEYPGGTIPWKRDNHFPVRMHVSHLTGDDEPQVSIRSTTYALAIEGLAHDRVIVHMQPGIFPESAQPRFVSDADMRKVERLLAQAWDIIDPL
jgi:3-deoxy-D-arabino-heptulosonate 7-phosphate (DAHP) synthase